MDVTCYIEEVEKCIETFKGQVEKEKKDIAESQKHFANLISSFSQKAPSNSVISSLFKDEEPEGFVFSKYEEKRKQLAEQRRAEYNAFLEKKEAEFLAKHRHKSERTTTPKSILDSVDYEKILAKRKEEEAKFRNMNVTDILNTSNPVLGEVIKKYELKSNSEKYCNNNSDTSHLQHINLPGSTVNEKSINNPLIQEKKDLDFLKKQEADLLEQRIAKQLEEQKKQMLLIFENELKKNNQVKEEIENFRSQTSSAKTSPRKIKRIDDFPKLGITGGGGDPVRDSFGNLLTMRGTKKDGNSDYKSILNFPSMQQEPIKDRMTLYREELQRQIEEKKRLEAIERAKAQELEAKIAQRIEEQRLQMQREYEKELEKNNKIKEEFQRQQERIRKLEEFQKKDAEARRKKIAEAKPPELEKPPPAEVVVERSLSPPIPAVRTKVLLEKVMSPKQTLPEVKTENVFSSLAEIRRKLMEDQQKPLKNSNSYEVMNRRTVQDISDDDDDDLYKSSYS